MSISRLFGLLISSLLLALFAVGAKAQTSYAQQAGAYSHNPAFQRYVENRTLENFENIDPRLRPLALADLLVLQEMANSHKSLVIEDRSVILDRYFENAPSEFKSNVQALAFDIAINTGTQEIAKEIFEQAASRDPVMAARFVCMSITSASSPTLTRDYQYSEVALQTHKHQIKRLLPFIARTPGTANSTCQIKSEGRILQSSIAGFVAKSDPKLLEELNKHLQAASVSNQAFVREYSSCNELQLRRLLSDAVVGAHELRVGEFLYFGRRQDQSCFVDARIVRVQKGYQYAPSNGVAGYMRKAIFFVTLDQLVAQLKANPNSNVYYRPAPYQPVVSTPIVTISQPSVRPEKEDNLKQVLSNPFEVIRNRMNGLTQGRSK